MKKIILFSVLGLIISGNLFDISLLEYPLRRIRGEVIPERYQEIVNQLNHPDWLGWQREEAIEVIKDIVIIWEKEEQVRRVLTLKVVEKLSDPMSLVRKAAASALGKIIPSLKDESLKEDLALKVVEKLSDPDSDVRGAVASALGEIIPSLKDEFQKVVALKVVEKLSDPEWFMRKAAASVLGEIIPSLKDETLKEDLALRVADKLSDPEWYMRGVAAGALGEIIPFLEDESLKEDLALRVADKLSDPEWFVRWAAVSALRGIIPSLKDESLKEDLALRVVDELSDPNENVRLAAVSALYGIIPSLNTVGFLLYPLLLDLKASGFFDDFHDIDYQLRVAKAFGLIDEVVNYKEMIEDSARVAKLSGNSLFKGIETAALLWIYQNISEFLRYTPSDPEFSEFYPTEGEQEIAEALQDAVERLEEGILLPEELGSFLEDFIYWTIQEVINNELEAQEKGYPSVGGKIHLEGIKMEEQRGGINILFGIRKGAGFFGGEKEEYLLSPVHSAKNLDYIITALKTMGLIRGEQRFQFTIRGRMLDEVKYIGWLIRGLLPEIIYNVISEGESSIGPHGDIVHGGGNLDVRPGETFPSDSYGRTDFLFLWTTDNFEEIVTLGQYFASLLQNDEQRYDNFVQTLEEIYSQFSITKEQFRNYVELRYKGRDRKKLLRRINKIPWDREGKVKLDWIFTARWFDDSPRRSNYGLRYEASWEGAVLQVVLHEAFKYYYEQDNGEGSWASYLRQVLRETLDIP